MSISLSSFDDVFAMVDGSGDIVGTRGGWEVGGGML